LTEVAGPGPLKYPPCTSTFVICQLCPAGIEKSSASSSSRALWSASKFCELMLNSPGLSYWS
jgi:hypothetical protein